MRRVVHFRLGYCFLHRQRCRSRQPHPCAMLNQAFPFRRILPTTDSVVRSGVPRILIRPIWLIAAPNASFPRGANGTMLPWKQAIADSGLEESDITNERTGIIMGSGGPSTQTVVQAADIYPQKRVAKAHRAIRGSKGDVFHRVCNAGNLVQDPRRQLFHFFGLFHVCPLHRQCLRADPDGQAGHHLCRWA